MYNELYRVNRPALNGMNPVGWVAGNTAKFVVDTMGYVIDAFPQPMKFILKNAGWILLGLLVMGVLGFLMYYGII